MALSSHQLLPANAGAGADSENTRNSENVDVDDPLFWQKVMPDFVTPVIMMSKLNDLTKLLVKKQTSNNENVGERKRGRKK